MAVALGLVDRLGRRPRGAEERPGPRQRLEQPLPVPTRNATPRHRWDGARRRSRSKPAPTRSSACHTPFLATEAGWSLTGIDHTVRWRRWLDGGRRRPFGPGRPGPSADGQVYSPAHDALEEATVAGAARLLLIATDLCLLYAEPDQGDGRLIGTEGTTSGARRATTGMTRSVFRWYSPKPETPSPGGRRSRHGARRYRLSRCLETLGAELDPYSRDRPRGCGTSRDWSGTSLRSEDIQRPVVARLSHQWIGPRLPGLCALRGQQDHGGPFERIHRRPPDSGGTRR